jgi:cytochrome bd-type quinol oxidase subunit 2
MVGWVEARTEAMFKRVEGGFIFGVGGSYYLVTEAQKAEIQRLMRTQSRHSILLIVLLIVCGALLVVGVGGLTVGRLFFGQPDRWVDLMILLVSSSLWVGLLIVNLINLTSARGSQKRLGPVLEGARHTDQKITWRDPIETYARMLPMSLLFGGAVASVLLFILIAASSRRVNASPASALGFLALLVVVFSYLAILKLRLERLRKR